MQTSLKPLLRNLLTVILLIICSFCHTATAQGNLLITPKRIVFEGNKRSEEINLVNIGKDTANYLISFVHYRMKEDGIFERITEPDAGQFFADKNLRFFPRNVLLAPNEAQTVKVQVVKGGDLQPGEYRSHIYLRANPPQAPLGEKNPAEADSGLSIKLIPIFGISIPIIIRKGESTAGVTISDVNISTAKDSAKALNITFNRTGNMSVYGDVIVTHIAPDGTATKVGAAKGMAVYTPNTLRRFHLLLEKNPAVNYKAGKLKVVYADQSGKPKSLAEAELNLR